MRQSRRRLIDGGPRLRGCQSTKPLRASQLVRNRMVTRHGVNHFLIPSEAVGRQQPRQHPTPSPHSEYLCGFLLTENRDDAPIPGLHGVKSSESGGLHVAPALREQEKSARSKRNRLLTTKSCETDCLSALLVGGNTTHCGLLLLITLYRL